MVPERIEQPSEANWLAYQQDFCACECVRSPRPFGTKNCLWRLPPRRQRRISATLNGVSRKKAARVSTSDLISIRRLAILRGARRVGAGGRNSDAFNLIQGRLVPPVATAAQL